MKCPRNETIDCYYVKTAAQADGCLEHHICQAQGDKVPEKKL